MIRIITLVLCLSFASMSFGTDENGNYVGLGLGTNSCDKFISAFDQANKTQNLIAINRYISYTNGALTGINIALENTYNILGGTELTGALFFLEKYCRDNPLDDYGYALYELLVELESNRTLSGPLAPSQ